MVAAAVYGGALGAGAMGGQAEEPDVFVGPRDGGEGPEDCSLCSVAPVEGSGGTRGAGGRGAQGPTPCSVAPGGPRRGVEGRGSVSAVY